MQPKKDTMRATPSSAVTAAARQRAFRWARALTFASGLLLAAASGTHAQTSIWAPTSSDCSAASLGGGNLETWHTSATPKYWCSGGVKSSWTDGTAIFPNNGALNVVTLSAGVPLKTLEFQGNTHLFGPGISFAVTANPMVMSAESGMNGDVYPTIDTNGTLEKTGPGTVRLLGPSRGDPLKVSGGTIVIGEQGIYKGSLTGTVDLVSGTLNLSFNSGAVVNITQNGSLPMRSNGGSTARSTSLIPPAVP